MFEVVSGLVSKAVSQPVNSGWVLFVFLVIIILFFAFRHCLDVIMGLWKLPFTIALDALDLLAFNKPYLDVVSALGSLIIFWSIASRGHRSISKVFAVIAALEALVGIWFFPQFAFITNLFPTSTILMFVLVMKKH